MAIKLDPEGKPVKVDVLEDPPAALAGKQGKYQITDKNGNQITVDAKTYRKIKQREREYKRQKKKALDWNREMKPGDLVVPPGFAGSRLVRGCFSIPGTSKAVKKRKKKKYQPLEHLTREQATRERGWQEGNYDPLTYFTDKDTE